MSNSIRKSVISDNYSSFVLLSKLIDFLFHSKGSCTGVFTFFEYHSLRPEAKQLVDWSKWPYQDFGLSKVGLINSTEDLSGGASENRTSIYGENDVNSKPGRERQKQSVVGTPDYLAPEILLGVGHGATADWWSFGVILYELLVGIPPFNAESPQQVFANIMNRDIPWPKIPEEMSYEAYDPINKLLIENPAQRLGAIGVVHSQLVGKLLIFQTKTEG
ncbi:unnamed protein product [Lactuca saligna]|uniref:non-specific serine/threonine protein kinase n=1 Tax=Lactuca saligna TaxID=75948 RepID=A0AA35ZM28_LACSI|nr:unnamed protein product [Lactuca saligna]